MSVSKFKQELLNAILELLWKQWTQLGIAGQINTSDNFVLDPEALLIFSAHFARYDQRLYDLVIDWLQCNGKSINLPRLKALLKRFNHADRKSLGFIAASVKSKKWQPFAKGLLLENTDVEPMFFENDFVLKPNETALRYGLKRNQYVQSYKVMPFASKGNASLLLRLRGAFGMSARAEAILTMLNKEFCRIQDVADAGGFSWKSASDVLDELCTSGVAVTLDKSKRGRSYFLKDASAIRSLFGVDTVKFPDWRTIFEMLSVVWHCISNPRLAEVSEKTVTGELQREFTEKIGDLLQNCGITSLGKLTAESLLTLPEIVQEIN
jgi:hypothetical protein